MKRQVRTALLLAVMLPVIVHAAATDRIWVVGSFRDATTASEEAGRIGREIGEQVAVTPVLIDGEMHYRLLVIDSAHPDAALLARFEAAGIRNPWTIAATETVFPATRNQIAETTSPDPEMVSAANAREVRQESADGTGAGEPASAQGTGAVTAGPAARATRGTGTPDNGALTALAAVSEPDSGEQDEVGGAVGRVPPAAGAEGPGEATDLSGVRTSASTTSARPPGGRLDRSASRDNDTSQTIDRGSLIGLEERAFADSGIAELDQSHASVRLQLAFRKEFPVRDGFFSFVPFYRWDQRDSERTHFDLREFGWVNRGDAWQVRTGIHQVFWGVTEALHLVDIVNQTDLIENPDGEEKLGQLMIALSLFRKWGDLDLYVLPRFRPRVFPDREGRPRVPFLVDEDAAEFESGAEKKRVDLAVRWSRTFGGFDLGISYFAGTSREPSFQFQPLTDEGGVPVDARLIPAYDVIRQTGLDARYVAGDWEWKLEAIARSGQGESYRAATVGVEKTFTNLWQSGLDLGLLAEYLHDSRDQSVPLGVYGEDDVALGLRLKSNHRNRAEGLVLWTMDRAERELLTTVEARIGLGEHWQLAVEGSSYSLGLRPERSYAGLVQSLTDPENELGLLQDEDFLKVELIRRF